tara:strand:+ start:1550 stop:1867 length:318 start_codon:yes stop_codon:yes gene_type:complete
MAAESKLEAYFVRKVRASEGRVRKLSWVGHNGAPDRMVWWQIFDEDPLLFFVELKAPGKKPNKRQEKEIGDLRHDGFDVFVIDSIAQADAFMAHAMWVRKSHLSL